MALWIFRCPTMPSIYFSIETNQPPVFSSPVHTLNQITLNIYWLYGFELNFVIRKTTCECFVWKLNSSTIDYPHVKGTNLYICARTIWNRRWSLRLLRVHVLAYMNTFLMWMGSRYGWHIMLGQLIQQLQLARIWILGTAAFHNSLLEALHVLTKMHTHWVATV